jgi:Zn-dependent alcohol dehydrogenase
MQYDAIEVQAFNAANPADAAKVVQKTVKEPGQGEVLVQMKYAGVRHCCCCCAAVGTYPHTTAFTASTANTPSRRVHCHT